MRRLGLALIAALAVTAQAHAATLTVSPSDFSPRRATLLVSAKLTIVRQVGVRLALPNGRPVGWIVPPARRTTLSFGWDGRIAGHRVPDGNYIVKLVYRSSTLAVAPLRIDTTPPELVDLHVGNGSTPFAGDGPLLTTVSPNGDKFRDDALVTFRLREPATVTMEVTRTVKVPHVLSTQTVELARGEHQLVWTPAATTNPRTFLIRLTAVDRLGNKIVYGAPNAFVGRYPRGPVVRVQGIDAGFTKPSYLPA